MNRLRLFLVMLAILTCTGSAIAPTAQAGPPSYLLLRRAESPAAHGPGYDGAQGFDARAQGYAYGYFGACPRVHPQRQFGIHRLYTQWSWW